MSDDDETTGASAAEADEPTEAAEPTEPTAEVDEPTEAAEPRIARGSIELFALSLILVLGAAGGVAMSARGFLASLALLWFSAACSVAAAIAAIAALWVRRRS